MDALENGRLFASSSSSPWYGDASPARSTRAGCSTWALGGALVGVAVFFVVSLLEATPSSAMHLHSTTAVSRVARTGVAVVPTTQIADVTASQGAARYGSPAVGAPAAPFSAFGEFLRSPSLSAVSGGLAAAATFCLIALFGRSEARVAMATTSGITDKGSDPGDQGSDAQTERHRIEQRVVFTAERWRKHRSGSRFSRALSTMPQSYVIRHVVSPVLAISVFTAAVCAAQVYFGIDSVNLPTSLFSLSAPSLGLLLVFRTNASYERWDGARKMIGLVKNRSEDLIRQVCVRFPASRPELKEQMLRYIHAFFFALKVHLRQGPGGFEDDTNLIQDLTPILKPRELETLLQSTNRPAHCTHCMTEIAKAAGIEGGALFCLDQNITVLADVIGGCERILRTPIPLSYTRMTTRFLFVWLLLLPFALSAEILKLDHSIWLTVPAVSFIAFALLGSEEVGVQIEEPFSILPMEAYAEGSRKNTASIYAQMTAVAEVVNGRK